MLQQCVIFRNHLKAVVFVFRIETVILKGLISASCLERVHGHGWLRGPSPVSQVALRVSKSPVWGTPSTSEAKPLPPEKSNI